MVTACLFDPLWHWERPLCHPALCGRPGRPHYAWLEPHMSVLWCVNGTGIVWGIGWHRWWCPERGCSPETHFVGNSVLNANKQTHKLWRVSVWEWSSELHGNDTMTQPRGNHSVSQTQWSVCVRMHWKRIIRQSRAAVFCSNCCVFGMRDGG